MPKSPRGHSKLWRDNQGTDLWLYFRWEFGEQPWWLQGTLKQAEALVCLQPCCVKRMLLPWEKTMKCPMASMNLILWQRNLLCSSMRGSEKLPKVLISERQMPWFYPHAEGLWWFFLIFSITFHVFFNITRYLLHSIIDMMFAILDYQLFQRR